MGSSEPQQYEFIIPQESDQPIVHSYRVFSIGEGAKPSLAAEPSSHSDPTSKPILMCFICKLSFGFAKSFEGHCTGEHGVELSKEEQEALQSDANCSAIIQGREIKRPMVSMIEYFIKCKMCVMQTSYTENTLHKCPFFFMTCRSRN